MNYQINYQINCHNFLVGKFKLDEDKNVVVLKDFPPNKIVHDVLVLWVGPSYFMTPVSWITTPRISPVLLQPKTTEITKVQKGL